MKINKKIQSSIVKDPLNLTRREFAILSALAENEINEWTMFYNNLQNEYAKQQDKSSKATKRGKGDKKSSRANR